MRSDWRLLVSLGAWLVIDCAVGAGLLYLGMRWL